MFIKINSENAEFQIIHALKNNRVKRKKAGEVFVEGIECIKQAIAANAEITRIIIIKHDSLSNWGKDVIRQHKDAEIIEMGEKLFAELCDKDEPSEMLITARIKPVILKYVQTDNPFFVVFDRPADRGNLGSLIRSANAFNADAVLIAGHGVDVYDPKVIRASLGSIFFTKIIAVESIDELTDFIAKQKKKNKMAIMGTDSDGSVSAADLNIRKPVMLIIGNEAKGMSVKLKELCDTIVKIPMSGNVNSLNVSCAASIMMWEVYKNSTGTAAK